MNASFTALNATNEAFTAPTTPVAAAVVPVPSYRASESMARWPWSLITLSTL
jgi:hypothetical protein